MTTSTPSAARAGQVVHRARLARLVLVGLYALAALALLRCAAPWPGSTSTGALLPLVVGVQVLGALGMLGWLLGLPARGVGRCEGPGPTESPAASGGCAGPARLAESTALQESSREWRSMSTTCVRRFAAC